jgi:hypothetical protein
MSIERNMKQVLFEVYRSQLLSIILETEVFDAEGRVLLSPGLKAKDVQSGYEYTVDRVEGTGDDAIVHLKSPEDARFSPPAQGVELLDGDVSFRSFENPDVGQKMRKVRAGERPEGLAVTAKEFKKNFEVE